jgi:hypothetical protein
LPVAENVQEQNRAVAAGGILRGDRDVKAHSSFRTKRLILEIYDVMAEASDLGEADRADRWVS